MMAPPVDAAGTLFMASTGEVRAQMELMRRL